MTRFHQLAIVATLSFITVTGCSNNAESPSSQASPNVTPTVTAKSASQNTETTPNEGVQGLLAVVSRTKAAADKGDFTTAKKEYDGFETIWQKIEDPIKAKYKGNYDAIEKNMDTVEGSLKDSQPSKEKLSTALQSLEKSVKALPKS
jgi:septal ring factor EnvC (AmiA/AmiB activator)